MTTSTPDQRHLAALIDGEPGPTGFEAAIRAAEQDASLRGRFERSLLIGQILRAEPVLSEARAISGRVAKLLPSEPVALRPRQPSARQVHPINRPAAALALAASLVTVAVLVGPSLVSRPGSGEAERALAGAADSQQSVDGLAGPVEPSLVAQWSLGDPASSTDLDALLVDHRERASASGLTGFIPYAAVVGRSGVR